MRVVSRVRDFRSQLDHARREGLSVGLVPTMGFLHEGHLSLVRRSVAECDLTAVTVFLNPLQFGDQLDLATYPRDLESDVAAAAAAGAEVVFAPSVEEMYPEPPATAVTVGPLSRQLEGTSRPGHLVGVATVVVKLFNAAGPCRAYFGEKDFQQLRVVERLVRDLSFPVEVLACPTVREPDGLARSSRNVYLSGEERQAAPGLYRALCLGAALVEGGERDPAVVRARMTESMAQAGLVVDYAELVTADDLRSLHHLEGHVRLLVAAHIGQTRLIDNVGITVPSRAETHAHAGGVGVPAGRR